MTAVDTVIGKKLPKIALDEIIESNTLLDCVDFFRFETYRQLDLDHRAKLGQFFTPPSVARLMTSMFRERHQIINILDPGAGIGSLSAAFIVAASNWMPKPKSIFLTAYEIDPFLINYLQKTFDKCAIVCNQAGIGFSGEIISEDFIAAGIELINHDRAPEKQKRFNCIIMNPPYHKIKSHSMERRLLRMVDIETSNIYTAFLWLSFKLLEPKGELVAITPRSFCNGPYFRPFRKAFFESMNLSSIHVFESRKKTFQEDDILQENIIMHAIKSNEIPSKKVIISSSIGPDDEIKPFRAVDHSQIVKPDDCDSIIYIIFDDIAREIGERMSGLDFTLCDLNLTVSTGRVVDFRAREHQLLRDAQSFGCMPLIYPAHFSQGFVKWPNRSIKKPDGIAKTPEANNLLVPSGFYVLVKRFSSKEEPRRIVAAVYDPDRTHADFVGFENHLNYFHKQGKGMPKLLAKGLAAFLNSTLIDQYFRKFSGHTQVNAADLRNLKYPCKEKLEALGSKIGDNFPQQDDLDNLIWDVLSI